MLLKQIALFALVAPLSMGCLFADEVGEQEDCCLFYGGQGDRLNPCAFSAGYGEFGGIGLDRCIDIFVSGDFIYWSPKRRLRGDVFKYQNNATNTIKIIDEHTGYRPGFKIGVGVTLPNFDNWTLEASYTRYHHDFTNTVRTSGTETVSPKTQPLFFIPFTQVRSKMTYNYDDLRLFLARPIYLSPCLILKPMLILRGTINEMNLSQTWTLPPALVAPGAIGADFQDSRLKFWSADIGAGGYGYMLLGCGLRLVIEGQVCAGYFRAIKNHQTVINNSTINIGATVITNDFVKKPFWLGPVGTAGGGLAWGAYFCDQQYHVDISVMYEMESQWGPFLYDNLVFVLFDTQYRGLTVHAQFDF